MMFNKKILFILILLIVFGMGVGFVSSTPQCDCETDGDCSGDTCVDGGEGCTPYIDMDVAYMGLCMTAVVILGGNVRARALEMKPL